MRRLLFVPLLLACLAPSSLAKPVAYKAGRIVPRTTRGGVQYAVYVPERWRKHKPLPVVIHVPHAHRTPVDLLEVPYVREEMRAQNAVKGHRAFHVLILMEAHNKENATQKDEIDPFRFAKLIERDAACVAAVLEEMSAEVAVQRDAIVIRGSNYCAEVAIGVATRRPDLYAVVALKDMGFAARVKIGGRSTWTPLPVGKDLEAAADLPIVITWDPGEPNGASRQKMHEDARDLLRDHGFRRIEMVPGVPSDSYRKYMNPESLARCFEIVEERRERVARAVERDGMLEKARKDLERGRLDLGVRGFTKARAFETKHGLDAGSDALWADLERVGRERLGAADALDPAKRKACYRKLARMFKGTLLAGEIREALRGM